MTPSLPRRARVSLVRLFALLGAALLVATVSACRSGKSAIDEGAETQTLHLGNLSEPSDLDPQVVSSLQDFQIVLGLIEGLTNYDPITSRAVPGVAERWEATPDGLTWTFHLRADARWSNGDPVTAADFTWSFQRMLSAGLASEYAYMLFCLEGAQDFLVGKSTDFTTVGVRAPDPRTLVLRLTHPVPYLPDLMAHASWYPVHRATVEKHGGATRKGTAWTRPENFVGNGPFLLTEWRKDQIIRLTKSPTYWDAAQVRLNAVHIYPIESSETEERMFRSGQLHVTSQVPTDKIAVYKNDPALKPFLHQDPHLATYFFRFNVTRKPLDDVRVRRALMMAVNRELIVEQVTKGGQIPAYNLTPPGTAGYTAPASTSFNVTEAKRLLAEAGFPEGRGFPKLEYLYNTTDGHRKIAEAVQQMWRTHLGIDIQLYNVEARVWNDMMQEKNYDIARFAWVSDYLDPSSFLDLMTSTSGNNQTGWAHPEYDRLVAEAARTPEQEKRFELFRAAEKLLIEDAPISPLYFYVRNNLQQPMVKGWHGNLLDIHPYKGVYLER